MLSALAALGLALSPQTQSAAHAEAEYIVPTQICRGYWLIPVALQARDGDEDARTLWFLHDTGASNTYVDPDSLQRVSGRRFEPGRRVNLVDASAGPVRINRLPTRVRELDHLSITLGRQIDGLMSVHVLDDFLMVLDYPASQMRLRRGALPRPDGETVFSSRGPDRRPWINVDFAGREQRLLVDSGAGALGFAVNDIDRFDLVAPARPLTGAVRIDRLEPRRLARLDGQARLAGLSFVSPVLEEAPRSPLLGAQALQHFVVTLDQRQRRLKLRRVTDGPIPASDHYEFGAVMRPTTAGFELVRVFDQTPLHAAGARPGDIITHFGDIPAAERGCDFALDGGEVSLRLLRDGEQISLDLVLTPVLAAPE